MLKKLGIPMLALAAILLTAGAPAANAAHLRWGVSVGPAYTYPVPAYPYGYGYYAPYPDYYPYSYTAPVYPYAYGPSFSFGFGGHRYDRDRGHYRGHYQGRGHEGSRGGHRR